MVAPTELAAGSPLLEAGSTAHTPPYGKLVTLAWLTSQFLCTVTYYEVPWVASKPTTRQARARPRMSHLARPIGCQDHCCQCDGSPFALQAPKAPAVEGSSCFRPRTRLPAGRPVAPQGPGPAERIGAFLRQVRERAELSQGELAANLGVTQSAVAKIEGRGFNLNPLFFIGEPQVPRLMGRADKDP